MNVKEELTKLLMESYDRGVKDATQEALAALEKVVAVMVAREIDDTNGTSTYIAAAIRARRQA